MAARLILVCGLPGAGKTTLARQLETRLPAMRLCPDEWLLEIGIDLHDEPPRDRLEQIFWRHTQRLLGLGTSVILESGFWLRSDRDEKRLGARALGVPVELHYLDVPMDELWRRVKLRNESEMWQSTPITRDMMDGWLPFFQVPDADEQALFDEHQVRI
jgi:predicted kinase